MLTVFERVPDEFVRLYDGQLQNWARNFRKVGKVAVIKFTRPLSADKMGKRATFDRFQIVGVRLKADLDAGRIVVSPQTDEDAEAISAHLADLRWSGARLH